MLYLFLYHLFLEYLFLEHLFLGKLYFYSYIYTYSQSEYVEYVEGMLKKKNKE